MKFKDLFNVLPYTTRISLFVDNVYYSNTDLGSTMFEQFRNATIVRMCPNNINQMIVEISTLDLEA